MNDIEVVHDKRANKIVVELTGRINKCGAITPRFDLKLADMDTKVYQILPSRQYGFCILTTKHGIMDHNEARRKHLGGKLLGYFY